jgi:glyoxylase-like metal-dependent hydrolase (beta-lactamase superfamily II)
LTTTKAGQEIKEKTGAEILIHEGEKEFIDFKPDRFLKDDEEIKIGNETLKVIHTPGHTEGSVCLIGNNFIFHFSQ